MDVEKNEIFSTLWNFFLYQSKNSFFFGCVWILSSKFTKQTLQPKPQSQHSNLKFIFSSFSTKTLKTLEKGQHLTFTVNSSILPSRLEWTLLKWLVSLLRGLKELEDLKFQHDCSLATSRHVYAWSTKANEAPVTVSIDEPSGDFI